MLCAMSSSVLLGWLAWATVTVSIGSDIPTVIHGIKGQFIHLDIQNKTEHHSKITWKLKNGKVFVRDGELAPKFVDKVKLFKKNGSIQLNHLTDDDNGDYIAYKQEKWEDVQLASYKLIILEAVSKPEIVISCVDSDDNSRQNGSFNVNCSSSNSWASYKCNENECSGLDSSPGTSVNITVTGGRGRVECSASNPGSTKRDLKNLTQSCSKDRAEEQQLNHNFRQNIALTTSVICAAALLLLCGTLIWKKCRNSKSEGTTTKHTDVPTVIVTGSDVDDPGCVSVYSVINKSAKCSVVQHSAQITSSSHQAQRLKSSEEKHKSQHDQKNRGKHCPLEDTAMTIYTTATKPQENPTEDTDRTVYARATKPQEEECPLEDTARTIYDTARPTTQRNEQLPPAVINRTQTDTNQPDTVYYTLGHITSGQQ